MQVVTKYTPLLFVFFLLQILNAQDKGRRLFDDQITGGLLKVIVSTKPEVVILFVG